MNQGPLPGMGGLPAPLHDTADARINYNSSLLGDITPYAYGEPGYLSSQTAYLNIPHRIQKVIPTLWLPEPMDNNSFRLCHPVDEGDLAFVMRLDRNSEICTGMNNKTLQRAGLGTAIDPFINLATLNYLLAGLQICTLVPGIRGKWDSLMHHLDSERYSGDAGSVYTFNDIKHIVENLIRPFGIVHGKDNQGGQSEATLSSVQWPVSFVTNMILDGKDANIVNIWHYHDISAGDDLVLRLKLMPLPPGNKYTLNHYRKGVVEKTFPPGVLQEASLRNHGKDPSKLGDGGTVHKLTYVWQLVPEIFSLDLENTFASPKNILDFITDTYPLRNLKFFDVRELMPWQHVGYWHIARTQVQSKKYGSSEYYFNDMAMNLRLGHIDSTFQPCFCRCPCNSESMSETLKNILDSYASEIKMGMTFKQLLDSKLKEKYSSDAKVSSEYSDTCSHTSLLRLGHDIDLGKRKREDTTVEAQTANLPQAHTSTHRIPVHRALLARPTRPYSDGSVQLNLDKSSAPSGLEEDIGVFDDAGPVGAGGTSAVDAVDSVGSNVSVPAFTVSKPGLKSAARKSGKGKGVVSSVLGADGSIRLEQSRML